MNIAENLKILGLSKKEIKVLGSLQDGKDTPLELARASGVSRTAVYAILKNLKKRGMANTFIRGGKKYWKVEKERNIEKNVSEAKQALLGNPEGRQELQGISDSTVVVHRGEEAIKKVMQTIFLRHKRERMQGMQGGVANIGWEKIFTPEETDAFNQGIKKNEIIIDAVLPQGWFEKEFERSGEGWAKQFEGRATRVNMIEGEYFDHGGQLFIFKSSLYLASFNEEVVIEIRHSEIQKMVLKMFAFLQDNSRLVDANALLRELMEEKQEK